MLKVEEIKRLARLARLAVKEEELASLTTDLDKILNYVARLGEAKIPAEMSVAVDELTVNKMRSDEAPHAPGLYTDLLLEQFSSSRSGYLEVKPILANDKN